MSRNIPSTTRRISVKKDGISKSSKQNVDTIYLIQNENQILKLKNIQMEDKIATMKGELIRGTSDLAKNQQECEGLRLEIKRTELTDDIRLEGEKRSLQEKIQLLKGNCEIVARKISQARQATICEQNKIPQLRQQKKILERSLWECKTENQGTKVVLENLEKELERQRGENAELVSKRKEYGPKETEISGLIQERLRIIKSREQQSKFTNKRQGAQLLALLVNKIEADRKKSNFMLLQKFGFLSKIMKKRLFSLSLIRRKYLLFIKNQAMQKFRSSFRPMPQLALFRNILQNTRRRRIKNRIYRIWRSQANKRQYIKIRYFQAQTTLQHFFQAYTKSVLFSTFSTLKYLHRNPLHLRSASTIHTLLSLSLHRCQSMFFSTLNTLNNHYLTDLELEESAKEQSILLVLSVYFSGWAKLTRDNKVSNRFIKFKYFRELKKLGALRKKRELSEMLMIANEKIKEIDSTSVAFCHIKKQTAFGLISSLGQQKTAIVQKNRDLKQKLNEYITSTTQHFHFFSLSKISSSLKKGLGQAFTLWRAQNRKAQRLRSVMLMLHGKMMSDVNFGFVMIQRRKFQRLKQSIRDKIQSCEFSYNYLVKENAHIKEVLDNKLLELEKSKFSGILRRLVRAQKQVKHKYFYKFLKNGYKCWRFKRSVTRIDFLIEDKIKRVFFFLVKEINKEKLAEIGIENKINAKIYRREYKTYSLIFGIFQNLKNRNRKIKRIMQNIFNRNLQLLVYNSYNSIKRILTKIKQAEVQAINTKVQDKIKEANAHTTRTQETIEMLRQRLASKDGSLKARILLACRKIYVRNSSNRYLNYFNRWRNKLAYEKKVQAFVEIMQRKTRILLKNRLICNLIKKQGDQQVTQLKTRLQTFTTALTQATTTYQKYSTQSQNKMLKMQEQNKTHEQEGKILQKRTDRMDDVKVASFRNYWGSKVCGFVFREWKAHKEEFVGHWERVFGMLEMYSRRDTFMVISKEMKTQITKNRIRKNLSYIYAKKFRNNAGLGFKIWRIVNLNARMKQSKADYQLEVNNHKIMTQKYAKTSDSYDKSVNSRIGERKVRMIFDWLKKYTRMKIDNNSRKLGLETWLKRGYQVQFYRLFINKFKPEVEKKRKANKFLQSVPQKELKIFFYKLQDMAARKRSIKKLFLNKFIHYSLLKLYEQFFAKTKNYYRYVQITKKNHQTMRIQKVIQVFDKKRKDTLCKNIRRWRKNQYQINIGKKLFKRLTRKAIYNRYEGMFYAWKLESEAKKVLKYHHEEGEVKKRKVQIKRIEKFLHDFKKDKGLLLENEEGNFVMSPRFQKKKQQEQKKDKNLRYKFISRLIMTVNGYGAPIKAFNNLHLYMKLREKYRNSALFVLNHLRRPDTLLAFRTWRKAAAKFKQDFSNMERKDLIKILNKQKDKMQIQYSHKLSVDEQIDNQLNRYKVYSHQREKKQKLCAYVFMRNAKKVKGHAFSTWRNRVNEIQNHQSNQLARRGELRMQDLEEEIREMREIEMELSESNQKLREAVNEALEIAEMVKRISEERDKLSHLILEKNLTCQSLVQENQVLNSKLHLAQKEAIRLLIISGEQP